MVRVRLELTGTVQGVGFRPFVHRLAGASGLGGWVRNSVRGVEIEVEGAPGGVERFIGRLRSERPLHAAIATLTRREVAAEGGNGFRIVASAGGPGGSAEWPPDLATCADCLAELFDPADRRFQYPFLNCTGCGPRYSIVLGLPYDRENTTMRGFRLCPACREEYESPANRRFHAQPTACPVCGPQLAWLDEAGALGAEREEALERAAEFLEAGRIVAVKGIGGFHLLADARNEEAVGRLRERKHRPSKPLAVMMPDLASVRKVCEVSSREEEFLGSSAAPIVLLRRRAGDLLPEILAPGNPTLGVLLPYSPLHHLLMRRLGFPVVATSGNRAEEPICIDNAGAVRRLRGVADGFLVHDRPIARAVDDSVLRVAAGRELMLRRSRGYAPVSVPVGEGLPVVLAIGGDQKTALALTGPWGIRCGPHLGDLETVEALDALAVQRVEFASLAGARPEAVAIDLHPGYRGARLAMEWGLPLVRVQHHHAHVAACLAEHEVEDEVLGVAWDGTGYGPDGTLWGGEFLLATPASFRRFAALRAFPLPGGEQAIRQPRLSALGLLHEAGIPVEETPLSAAFTAEEWAVARVQLERGLNCPLTSSMGRLFDGVAALLGLRWANQHEGQAAMDLEFAAAGEAGTGSGTVPEVGLRLADGVLDWEPLLRALMASQKRGVPVPVLAARFHDALAEAIVVVARAAGRPLVVLSGGCFQNVLLLERAVAKLSAASFVPLWPRLAPPNDGGLALGQAFVAARTLVRDAASEA